MQKKPFMPQNPKIPFPHAELTHKIIGICYEVANELGSGFLESVYQNTLGIAFRQANMKALSQARMSVVFRGENAGDFIADFLIRRQSYFGNQSRYSACARTLRPGHQLSQSQQSRCRPAGQFWPPQYRN